MEGKIVWVLGAGFSRSLGGPLLEHLLSQGKQRELGARFPESIIGRDWARVYNLFWKHQRNNQRSAGEAIFWEHAEEFLDFVDTARQADSHRRRLIEPLISNLTLEELLPDYGLRANAL